MVQMHQDLFSADASNTGTNDPVFHDPLYRRALAKANKAVLPKNAQNFEGAIRQYRGACKVLDNFVYESSAIEDRWALDRMVRSEGRVKVLYRY